MELINYDKALALSGKEYGEAQAAFGVANKKLHQLQGQAQGLGKAFAPDVVQARADNMAAYALMNKRSVEYNLLRQLSFSVPSKQLGSMRMTFEQWKCLVVNWKEIGQVVKEMISTVLVESGWMLVSAIDPTPMSSGVDVVRALDRRDYHGAGLALLGLLPLVGSSLRFSARWPSIALKIERTAEKLRKLLGVTPTDQAVRTAEMAAKTKQWRMTLLQNERQRANEVILRFRNGLAPRQRATEAFHLFRSMPNGGAVRQNPLWLSQFARTGDETALRSFLHESGFVKCKEGSVTPQGVVEDSEIWLRPTVGPDGQLRMAAVRIDRKELVEGFSRQEQANTRFARDHFPLRTGPLTPAEQRARIGSGQYRYADVTHFHYELVPYDPADAARSIHNLTQYLTAPAQVGNRVVSAERVHTALDVRIQRSNLTPTAPAPKLRTMFPPLKKGS